ncbi:Cytidylate kinase [endosymbiont DhMRE of Dentiscutata heterogama]|uniref:(d)CMP kinase n=1 Tax=endosymbiont DhMRE of Dentiscutata heterogama TaxID=1609546 RepID=UPI000629D5D9|nr:(d)CMP kinase [endosymbiont DhMRE of Dentiscutata heterogama]CFW92931.1 Cytidylate kinase [endosymbiont DhMRE of Dentiscutata heterogama]
MPKINIAIDGPVGSGKTTIGRLVAQKLNYQFLDSGLLFRHFARFCQAKNVSTQPSPDRTIELCSEWQSRFLIDNPEIAVQLEQQRDILGSEKIGNLASQLAIIKELRTIILNCQRLLTQNKGWVVVGRDITSEVLPQAEVKIFLTASWEVRIRRRYQQHQGKINQEQVEKDLLARDEKDKNRILSPLRKTADSWELDTTHLSPAESIVRILDYIKAKKY